MYDSDEVRDAVRREVVTGLIRRWPESGSTAEEAAVMRGALLAVLSEDAVLRERMTAAVRLFCEAVLAWAEEVGRVLLDAIAAAVKPAVAAFEALGILDAKTDGQPMPWTARPRKPAMIFRGRRVGGRR